jgi:hypothetical protein
MQARTYTRTYTRMGKNAEPRAAPYRNDEGVFSPFPAQRVTSVHRREVQRFCRGEGTDGRRAWNPSTRDEQHPFPQPALLHTTACYNGVDVVPTYFPETVKGSGFLRMPEASKPVVWTRNRTRAAASSTRHTYRCDELAESEAARSYLAQIIVEDADPNKKVRRDRWCASTVLEGCRGNRFLCPAAEDSSYQAAHRELNDTLTNTKAGGYMTPYNRVRQLNRSLALQKMQKQVAEKELLESLYDTRTGPAVFKLSNADEWWDMDPVAVTRAMTERVEAMKANPYSTMFRTTASNSHS